jgi:hypothetical protein
MSCASSTRLACYANADEFLHEDASDFSGVAILVYREDFDDLDTVQESQQRILARHPGALIVHPAQVGRTVQQKMRTNALLSQAGVPVTRMVKEAVSGETVFSNHPHLTKQNTYLVKPGESLDPERYNTVFVDTTHRFNGIDYYVYVLAHAVGKIWISTNVGFRPTADGDPSVHLTTSGGAEAPTANNYFNSFFVLRYQAQIERLCEQVGAAFGLGFYTHDLLPCRKTGRLLLSESGLKFDAGPLVRARFWNLRERVPAFDEYFSAGHILKSSYAFVRGAQDAGYLT